MHHCDPGEASLLFIGKMVTFLQKLGPNLFRGCLLGNSKDFVVGLLLGGCEDVLAGDESK